MVARDFKHLYQIRAGSLNHLVMPLPLLLPLPVLPIKHWSLNYFPDTTKETQEDHWHWYMTAVTKPVGVSQVFSRPPMGTLFKDLYFVSGSGIVSDSGIARWFKDPAQFNLILGDWPLLQKFLACIKSKVCLQRFKELKEF